MTETLKCPSCSKVVNSTKTANVRDEKNVACPSCGARSTLGMWRQMKQAIDANGSEFVEPASDARRRAVSAPENAIFGKVLEERKITSWLITKVACVVAIVMAFGFYLAAFILCLTCWGAILGIPLAIGTFFSQGAAVHWMLDRWEYVVECPVCKARIGGLSLFVIKSELAWNCHSCKKRLILRNGAVFHVP